MVTRKKKQTTLNAAASFGVAMASLYSTPGIHAEILDITWNGGNASASAPFVPGGGLVNYQDVDQIQNGTLNSGSISFADFMQWNDEYGGTGRTMGLFNLATSMGEPIVGGPMSMQVVKEGDVIDPDTFEGAMNSLGAPLNIGDTELDGTGSAFVAIRPRIAPSNLYWFKIELPVLGGALVYSDGQYGDAGEALTVGLPPQCENPLGDIDGDGEVSLLDVAPFVDAVTSMGSGDFVCEADVNEDGNVDILDVAPFVALLTQGG